MRHDVGIPHRSERVGGQHSSTRAELAAVVMALHGTPRTDDLAILIDSAAAIQRLRWFRSRDFRPAEHKVKDYNIIQDILRELKLRSEASSSTLFVKVCGHSGDPLHEEADRLAVAGAEKKVMTKTFCIREAEAKRWSSTGLTTQVTRNHTLGAQQ